MAKHDRLEESVPRAFLVLPAPAATSARVERVRDAELGDGWTRCPAYIHRFPPRGTVTARRAPPPFPECAREHPPLVAKFRLLKLRADELEQGLADGYTPEDWYRFNTLMVLPLIHEIGRICRDGHVDLTMRRPEPHRDMTPPPLPGAVPARPEAGPAIPTGWMEYLPRGEQEMES